jgi:ferric-dicitrate binding protein FerR (iron transport regulator)
VLADSSLAHETLTASLAADSFDEALRTLTTVLALRAEHRGDSVVLHRRRGSRS